MGFKGCCLSVAKSCPDYFRPHELQHTKLPYPLLSPKVCSNSCPLSQWCHPTISSSVTPFFSFPQSFSASESFQWVGSSNRWLKYWSFSFCISPSNEYSGWFPLGLTLLISLLSKGLWRVFSITLIRKHQFFGTQPSFWSNSHIPTWLLEKP